MRQSGSVSTLLLSILVLWQWFSSSPALDKLFPYITVSWAYSDVYISLSEVVATLLMTVISLLFYCLFWIVARRTLSLIDNLLFVGCVSMLGAGNGMHVSCVTSEANIRDLGLKVDSLSALIHFMHEYWSHHSMVLGFFGMMLLVTWKEMNCTDAKKSTTPSIQNSDNEKQKALSPDSSMKKTSDNSPNRCVNMLGTLIVQWLLPLETGIYLSMFSGRTSTEIITTGFYIGVLSIMMLSRASLSKSGHFRILGSPQLLIVSNVVTKTAVVGLFTLCVNVVHGYN